MQPLTTYELRYINQVNLLIHQHETKGYRKIFKNKVIKFFESHGVGNYDRSVKIVAYRILRRRKGQ